MNGFLVGDISSEDLFAHGVIVRTRLKNLMTITLPLKNLTKISCLKGVDHIEAAKKVEPQLDYSRNMVNSDDVNNNYGLNGENVILGIVDTGIDFNHPDFKNTNGTTRILYLWDQSNSNGPNPNPFSYGTEWNASQINNGTCNATDNMGHGSHVAGIAGGNGKGTGNGVSEGTYVGMAPKSDFVIVKLKTPINQSDIVDGVMYIVQKAVSVNKPWIVNLSLGSKWGPKDGTSIFESMLTAIVNDPISGKGKIIVVSAGNEGYVAGVSDPNMFKENKYHSRNSGNGYTYFEAENNATSTTDYIIMEIWYPSSGNYQISIDPPGSAKVWTGSSWGNDISTYSFANNNGTGDPGYGWLTEQGLIGVHNNHFSSSDPDPFPNTPDNQIIITVEDYTYNSTLYKYSSGSWKITLSNGSGFWDTYVSQSTSSVYFSDSYHDQSRKITEPGNAVNILTVGSFNSKNSWIDVNNHNQPWYNTLFNPDHYVIGGISHFSSQGPVRVDVNRYGDPSDKPDVYAPGAWISSSKSSTASIYSPLVSIDNRHYHAYGTSMSAPHVAGACALALDLNPNLLTGNIKNILRAQTARFLDVEELIYDLFGIYVQSNISTSTNWGTGSSKEYILIKNTNANYAPITYVVSNATLTIGANAVVVVQKNVTLEPGSGGTINKNAAARIILAEGAELNTSTTDVDQDLLNKPTAFSVEQNYPNPFNPTTEIKYQVPSTGIVKIEVFNTLGQKVKTLINKNHSFGNYSVYWNGTNEMGTPVSSGIYIYRLQAGNFVQSRKMMLIK